MKRQWKLILEILLYVEQNAHNGQPLSLPEFADYTREEVVYHIILCTEAEFVKPGVLVQAIPTTIGRLTWKGHNELDRLRAEGC